MGIKLQARPTKKQKEILCSWMGAAKFVWNAKCQEDKYLRKFAQKYLSLGTYPRPNQQYSQYKDDELSPFLKDCPSQILRNSAANWYFSYQEFFKQKERGRPRVKKQGRGMTILLTRELFEFRKEKGQLKLFIGTKRNNIGILNIHWHDRSWQKYGFPNSIRIKKLPSGEFTVSFCYGEESSNTEKEDRKNWFDHIQKNKTKEDLAKEVLGIDRGINVACATNEENIHFKRKSSTGLRRWQKKLKREQKLLAKKQKSNRRNKKKLKVARIHKKISSIRDNECHHISKELANKDKKIFILESLPIKNQTRSANGKNVKAKSGLNREILNMGWYKVERQLTYKARKLGKVVFKINPAYTSQECADCNHTHADNRSGIEFKCLSCGKKDHADSNAAKVIKKRAINLLTDSGTELSAQGVLRLADRGRGAKIRPFGRNSNEAQAKNEDTQRKRQKRRKVAA